MTINISPPPTYENPVDEKTGGFSPVWLKWFVDLASIVNQSGGSGIQHNSLLGLQGGGVGEYLHLTLAQYNLLSVASAGTYTPTLTNVANLDGSTAYASQYLRVGSVVSVSGKADVNPTAGATSTKLGISLPVASTLSTAQKCSGTAFSSTIAGQGAAILGDTANNRAQMEWISGDVTNQPMYYTFTYLVT